MFDASESLRVGGEKGYGDGGLKGTGFSRDGRGRGKLFFVGGGEVCTGFGGNAKSFRLFLCRALVGASTGGELG